MVRRSEKCAIATYAGKSVGFAQGIAATSEVAVISRNVPSPKSWSPLSGQRYIGFVGQVRYPRFRKTAGLGIESGEFQFQSWAFRMLTAASYQNLNARRMAEKGLRTRGETIGTRLENDDQIAGLRRCQVHPVGKQVKRGA